MVVSAIGMKATENKELNASDGVDVTLSFKDEFDVTLSGIEADKDGYKDYPEHTPPTQYNIGDGQYGTYCTTKAETYNASRMRKYDTAGKKYYLYIRYKSNNQVGDFGGFFQFSAKEGYLISNIQSGVSKDNCGYSLGTVPEINSDRSNYTQLTEGIISTSAGINYALSAPSKYVRLYQKTVDSSVNSKWLTVLNNFVITFVPENENTLTFDSMGGSYVEPQTLINDQVTVEPEDPVKESTETARYTFDGWYEDTTYQTPFVFGNPLTSDKTIYAKWIETPIVAHILTFDSKGGSPVERQVISEGDATQEPANPTKEHTSRYTYTFDGWYEEETYQTPFIFGNELTSNKTIYAKWIENEIISANISSDLVKDVNNFDLDQNGEYSFWNSSISLGLYTGNFSDLNFSLTVYADPLGQNNYIKYSEDSSHLFLRCGHSTHFTGAHIDITPRDNQENYCLTSIRFISDIYHTTTSGCISYRYSIDGENWSEFGIGGSFVNHVFEVTNLPKKVRYFQLYIDKYNGDTNAQARITQISATYEKDTSHTLTFDTCGGSSIAPVSYNPDQFTVAPANPTKEGTATTKFTFSGWYEEPEYQNQFIFGGHLLEDKTIYAKWKEEEVSKYRIHFDLDGGTGDIQDQYIIPGEKVTKPANPTKINTGSDSDVYAYAFDNWKDSAGSTFDFNNTVPSGDITITAKYYKSGYCPTGWQEYKLTDHVKEYAAGWTDFGDHEIDTVTMTGKSELENLHISFTGKDSSSGVKQKAPDKWELLMYNATATVTLPSTSSKVIVGFRFEAIAEKYNQKYSTNVSLIKDDVTIDSQLSPYSSDHVVLCGTFTAQDKVKELVIDFPAINVNSQLSFKKFYVLYAETPADTYTVTYDANGGVGSVPVDSNSYLANEQATVMAPVAGFSLQGCVFAGWGDDPDNPTNVYDSGDKLTITTDVTLYAIWTFGAQADLDNVRGAMKLGYDYSKQLVEGEYVYSNDKFRIQAAIFGLETFVDEFNQGKTKQITNYGIHIVKPNKSEENVSFLDNSKVFKENEFTYVILNFGAALTTVDDQGKMTRMADKVSICAFVQYDGQTYYSNSVTTYSIADLVKAYYQMEQYREKVTELYNILVSQGYINEVE